MLPLIEIDFSDKIVNLVEKILNFMIVSTGEPNFIYNHQSNSFEKKSDIIIEDLEALKTKDALTHNRKNLSANLDRVFIDNLMLRQKEYEINKFLMFYQEMENIYFSSKELNDSVKLSQSINSMSNFDRKGDELVPISTHALLNIEMIKDYSDNRVSTYKRLLSSCTTNFNDISTMILSTIEKPKIDKNESNYFSNDRFSNINNKKDVTNGIINSTGRDKNSLINEKLEMLRNLREKKDQILNENLKKSKKMTKTFC